MSIDTAAKRRSAASLLPFHKAGIVPDGTISALDRAAIAWLYIGVLDIAGNIFKIVAFTTLYRDIKTTTTLHRTVESITALYRSIKSFMR